jgi:hypothetical protein
MVLTLDFKVISDRNQAEVLFMLIEKERSGLNGWLVVGLLTGLASISGYCLMTELGPTSPYYYGEFSSNRLLLPVLGALLSFASVFGFFTVNPNEAKLLQLFGTYIGTVKISGLRWVIPLMTRRSVSLRIRNFESAKLKVNDRDGSPIQIGVIVAWRVVNTVEAVFQVDRYEEYVHVQTEAAVRNLAMSYPYDAHESGQVSLHGSPEAIIQHLQKEIEQRLVKAGVEVIEARVSHLAYAPEIAASMLQRQQAGAIIAARQKIVEGAVGMVEMALQRLASCNIVNLDEERKASMVSNLLVVLCSERSTQPIVNAGTIYQ